MLIRRDDYFISANERRDSLFDILSNTQEWGAFVEQGSVKIFTGITLCFYFLLEILYLTPSSFYLKLFWGMN